MSTKRLTQSLKIPLLVKGEEKGDLADLCVYYKFWSQNQLYLLGYSVNDEIHESIWKLSVHEKFLSGILNADIPPNPASHGLYRHLSSTL